MAKCVANSERKLQEAGSRFKKKKGKRRIFPSLEKLWPLEGI